MKVYPIFLTGLAQRPCVVIGGGSEAERKVMGLLEADAGVTLISAESTKQLRLLADAGTITWRRRQYRPGDLQGAFLVLVTDYDPHLKTRVWEEARAEKALVQMTDDPAHSTFVAGAVMRQGALTIAISTSGCSPALAVRLRQQMERTFGPEYAAFLDLLQALRAPLAAHYPDFHDRRDRWHALVDSDVIDCLRQGKPDVARRRIAEIVGDPVLAAAEAQQAHRDGETSCRPNRRRNLL